MPRVVVYHRGYGCETGCCGHAVNIDADADDGPEKFSFGHPGDNEDPRDYAEKLVRLKYGEEHVADLDWDNCHHVVRRVLCCGG
jgi:hypothetical protein